MWRRFSDGVALWFKSAPTTETAVAPSTPAAGTAAPPKS